MKPHDGQKVLGRLLYGLQGELIDEAIFDPFTRMGDTWYLDEVFVNIQGGSSICGAIHRAVHSRPICSCWPA